jgi:hypothetical protein
MYREILLNRLTKGSATFLPKATCGEICLAQERLSITNRVLPVDYERFLSETGGFLWNGITFFGVSSAITREHDLVIANKVFGNAIPPTSTIVGLNEAFLYSHDCLHGYGKIIKPTTANRGIVINEFTSDFAVFLTQTLDDVIKASQPKVETRMHQVGPRISLTETKSHSN